MYNWKLVLMLMVLLIFSCAGTALNQVEDPKIVENTDQCLDQDVWVIIQHPDVWHEPSLVLVYVPKQSLTGDFENCPAEDTKVTGRAILVNGSYNGIHVVILKKGTLNDEKDYMTDPPPNIPIPADNIETWNVKH